MKNKKEKKPKNYIIVRIMENDVCLHAYKVNEMPKDLSKYTKDVYENITGGLTITIEIPVKTKQETEDFWDNLLNEDKEERAFDFWEDMAMGKIDRESINNFIDKRI